MKPKTIIYCIGALVSAHIQLFNVHIRAYQNIDVLLQNAYWYYLYLIHSHAHVAPSAPSGITVRLVQPLIVRVSWNAALYYSGSISQYTVYATPVIVPEQKRMTALRVIQKVTKLSGRLFKNLVYN